LVLQTDVQRFYASIEHQRLFDRLAGCIQDRRVLNLCGQYLRRTVERAGCRLYWEMRRGLFLGCPLSPVLGAFYLAELDATLHQHGFPVVRFMDDIVVLAPTRWKLRAAVRLLQQGLATLGLRPHPHKTFIGRIARGFPFLGYLLRTQGITAAPQTLEHMRARARQLSEQQPRGEAAAQLGAYVRRWRQRQWV
jgi:hypothetical protein